MLLFALSLFGCLAAGAQNNIVSYSYWFDNETDEMVTTTITPVPNYTLETSFSTNGISTGIHSFNIRFTDNSAHTSGVSSCFFFKSPVPSTGTKEIVEVSYWFDNAIGETMNQPIGPGQQLLINTDLEAFDLSTGIHAIHVRFKDNAGIWSAAASQFFFKAPEQVVENREIIAIQYWVDDAWADAVYETLEAAQLILLDDLLDLDSLSTGLHSIHARFLDNAQLWSATVSAEFYRPFISSQGENFITGCKYWFDADATNAETLIFPEPVNPRDLLLEVDMTTVWKGEHTLHFQFQDSLHTWGAVTTDTVYKNPLPVAAFACESSICLGDTVHFINNSLDADTYFWDLGDGTTTTDTIPQDHLYTEPGQYTVSLTVTDLGTGLDSTVTQLVGVYEIPSPELSLSGDPVFCEGGSVTISAVPGMTYEWSTGETTQSITVSTTGTYYANIYNASNAGCWILSDVADITVLEVDSTSMNATICYGEGYALGGQWLTEPGEYMEVFQAVSGCDSLVFLTLDVTVLDTSVTVNYPELTANLQGAAYQWVDCNTAFSAIPGATEQSFTPTESGSYAVIVEMDLCSDTSSCYGIDLTGMEHAAEKQFFTLAPNPATDQVFITLDREAQVAMNDEWGARVYHAVLQRGTHSISLAGRASGLYVVTVTAGTQIKQVKLIKKH